jgi:hypothetical protein
MKQDTVFNHMVYAWLAMPFEDAKASLREHMATDGDHSQLDFDLLDCSESIEECIEIVFGVAA